MSNDNDPSQKCVVEEVFGFQHPYAYCVKPSDKMVDKSTFDNGGWLMNNTAKVLGGMYNYVDYLVSDADKGTSAECLYENKGVIGNKYVLKTNIECTPVNSEGTVITPPNGETPYLHKYMNSITDGSSFLTGGQGNTDLTGVIPSAFYSATQIGENIIDLVSVFNGLARPYCQKASVKCHMVDYSIKGIRGPRNYSGNSPEVWFGIDELRNIKPENLSNGAITVANITSTPPTDGFKNMEHSNDTITDNIIKQNMDKIQNFSDFDKILNSINIDKPVKFEDELLVKMYYVGFSILMILIILKLVFKKK